MLSASVCLVMYRLSVGNCYQAANRFSRYQMVESSKVANSTDACTRAGCLSNAVCWCRVRPGVTKHRAWCSASLTGPVNYSQRLQGPSHVTDTHTCTRTHNTHSQKHLRVCLIYVREPVFLCCHWWPNRALFC